MQFGKGLLKVLQLNTQNLTVVLPNAERSGGVECVSKGDFRVLTFGRAAAQKYFSCVGGVYTHTNFMKMKSANETDARRSRVLHHLWG